MPTHSQRSVAKVLVRLDEHLEDFPLTHVIDEIVHRRKPMVGHNCLADLVRIYSDDSGGPSMISSGSLTRTEGEAPEPKDELELLPPGSAMSSGTAITAACR